MNPTTSNDAFDDLNALEEIHLSDNAVDTRGSAQGSAGGGQSNLDLLLRDSQNVRGPASPAMTTTTTTTTATLLEDDPIADLRAEMAVSPPKGSFAGVYQPYSMANASSRATMGPIHIDPNDAINPFSFEAAQSRRPASSYEPHYRQSQHSGMTSSESLPQPPQYDFLQPPPSSLLGSNFIEEVVEVSPRSFSPPPQQPQQPQSQQPFAQPPPGEIQPLQQYGGSSQQSQPLQPISLSHPTAPEPQAQPVQATYQPAPLPTPVVPPQQPQSQQQPQQPQQPSQQFEASVESMQDKSYVVDAAYGKHTVTESIPEFMSGTAYGGGPLVVPSTWKVPPTIRANPALSEELRRRSTVKRVGFFINANGRNGRHGREGHSGSIGGSGINGGTGGQDGGPGQDGGHGGNGEHGGDGEMAPNITLDLAGAPRGLELGGYISGTADIGDDDSIILVGCRGGNGGNGGNGGKGGPGGKGGNGGPGSQGAPGGPGQPGQNGGRGGNGGHGGRGGNGGNGSNGGHGARGGNALIQVTDPRLLALVEIDVTGGVGGKAGSQGFGGAGGVGGSGGPGGAGGPPGSGGQKYGSQGPSGQAGHSGHNGQTGNPGQRDGANGAPGSAMFMVVDPATRMPVYHGNRKFYPVVEGYTIRNAVNDAIFEPGQLVFLDSVSIVNSGAIPLPAGAILSLVSPDGSLVPTSSFELPQVPPDTRLIVNPKIVAQIRDAPPPTAPGRYQSKAAFSTQLSMLGRTFPASFQASEIEVQWPIHFEQLQCPRQAARQERVILTAKIFNCSGLVYGNEARPVKINWTLDNRFIPVRSDYAARVGVGQSIEINVEDLQPGQVAGYSIEVEIADDVDFYEQLHWSVGLLLRDRLIEISNSFVRIAGTYDVTQEPKDVLLITGSHTMRREYLHWKHLFNGLGAEIDIWDMTYNFGISRDERTGERHQNSFLGRYNEKLIVFPVNTPKYFSLWNGADLIDHFFPGYAAPNFDASDRTQRGLPESGLVITGIPSKDLLDKIKEDTKDVVKLTDSYSGTHYFFSPSESDAKGKEAELLKEIEERFPLNMHFIKSSKFAPYKKSGKWCYGELVIGSNPIPRTSHVLVLPALSSICEDLFNPLENNMIPMTSSFFSAFLATVSGMTTMKKIRLLLSDTIPAKNWVFTFGKEKHRQFQEIITACIYDDLKTEFFVKDTNLTRVHQLISFVDECTPAIAQKLAKHLFGLLARLQNATRWHAPPFTQAATIREKYFLAEQKLEGALEKHGCSHSSIKKMKSEGKDQGEAGSRLKLRDLMLCDWPFRFAETPSWF